MKRKKDKKRGHGWIVALAIVACLAGFAGYMAINAATLHVMRATVALEDLPPAFEGKRLLFASDIDLVGINTPKRAAAAFRQLEALEPDLLVLGGDYTAPTLLDLINQSGVANYASNANNLREDFFHYISDFPAPMGRYMILSPDDRLAGDMRPLAEECGFQLLDDSNVELSFGDDRLWLVGLGEDSADIQKLSQKFKRDDCVIAVGYSPSQFPAVMTAEAADCGHWVDLNLSGHTHGGQIRVFGHSILSLDAIEQQFIYGWNRETSVPTLVTSGMGCEGVNLRLNSRSEVWLITLTSLPGE